MSSVQHVELYTPAETEGITGVNAVLQRDHRRRFPEWLSLGSGHARFNLFQCLQMRFVADVSQFGVGPAKAYPSGEWVAHSALQYALMEHGCIAGDLRSDCTLPGASEQDFREYTARRVFAEAYGRPRIVPNEYAFILADGSEWFGQSLEQCMANLPKDDERRSKPMITVHLPSFASQVVAKLPRPAVRIFSEEHI